MLNRSCSSSLRSTNRSGVRRFGEEIAPKDQLCDRRRRIGQRSAKINEIARRPLAEQHLLRRGKRRVLIVGEADQCEETKTGCQPEYERACHDRSRQGADVTS